jgi:hypothetical protein
MRKKINTDRGVWDILFETKIKPLFTMLLRVLWKEGERMLERTYFTVNGVSIHSGVIEVCL